MGSRRILNLTSVKKKDTMMPALVATDGSVSPTPTVSVNLPANSYVSWTQAISYRERQSVMTAPARNLRDIYLKGFAETLRIDTNSPNPIMVRRLVVSAPVRIDLTGGITGNDTQPTHVVDNGTHFIGLGVGTKNIDLYETLFEGSSTRDWQDVFIAKIDNRRWRVHSDKTFQVRSGNTGDAFRQMKFWDPINKKVQYDDEERGNDIYGSGWTTTSTQGHQQNVYCIYIWYNQMSAAINPQITQQRTMYWHER